MGKSKSKSNKPNHSNPLAHQITANGFSDTISVRTMIYNRYLARLQNMVMAMFEWKGLPKEIPDKIIEWNMLNNGMCLFFPMMSNKFGVASFTTRDHWDMYYEPNAMHAHAPNGFQKDTTNKDSVIIYNNDLRLPTMPIILSYAEELTELDMMIRVNIKANKTPTLFKGSKDQMLSIKNAYMKYDGDEPFMFVDDEADFKEIFDVIKTDAPFLAPDMYSLKMQKWNECMCALAIKNVDTTKRERNVVAEVTGNDEQVELLRQAHLKARRDACDKINDMFGDKLDKEITVDFRVLTPLPNNGGGFTRGFDEDSLNNSLDLEPEGNNILTGGSEPVNGGLHNNS